MSFADDERRRVERDEMHRAYSREQYARFRNQQDREEVAKYEKRQRYVAHHGRDGVIRITVMKWMLAAALLAVFSFIGGVGEDGFFKALGQSILAFFGLSAIGAFHLANSVE